MYSNKCNVALTARKKACKIGLFDIGKDDVEMKLIAFDLDGTLCNTLQDITDSLNRALAVGSFPTFTLEEVSGMVGRSITYMCQRAMPKGHENDWENVQTRYFDDYARHLCDATRPYDGILPLLSALKARGYLLACVTNKPHAHAVSIIQTLFPDHGKVFSQVQGQAKKFTLKPDPATLDFVMQHLGVSKEDAIYVGDSEVDVLFAENTGLRFVGCGWGFRGEAFLKECGATTVIDTPMALLNVLDDWKF